MTMKKIWFFVEGNSEENLVKNMISCHYPDVHLEKDESRFIIDHFDRNACYCLNVEGVDGIAYRINEYNYRITRSGSREVIVICDVEDLNCNSSRREAIEDRLENDIRGLNIHYVFFNPLIERLYWDCPLLLRRVLKLFYVTRFGGGTSVPNIILPEVRGKYDYNLKKLFKSYGVKYRESKFSEEFFPRILYGQCDSVVIMRLMNFMDQILN